ncbi:hypothetical protein N7539_006462 [Penicillium diatomitis]|uniref:Uncharacterized protein n=1 Tax=Penicillium diatomitis TaxID=2819901 RepID=A0A9W9X383_9EURO|nr:uncharacterized protein N7539_006462 [Penicillium diatomitis]KAJ5483016.1 hypothetical protein N7539_006462 [Penicillium diatomitis]
MTLAIQVSVRSAGSMRTCTPRLWSHSRASQKRFASTASENKGGVSRPLLIVGALAVPAALYMAREKGTFPALGNRNKKWDRPALIWSSLGKEDANHPGSASQHPYMAESGKSVKGEGVIDTARLNGPVRVDRPAT